MVPQLNELQEAQIYANHRRITTEGQDSLRLNADIKPNVKKRSHTLPVKFKGIVPQPNGHWGAQIYANHQRIWLGTFKSDTDAAMAYDSASVKLKTGENHRNFPWTDITVHEPRFQSLHSTQAILNMIRDGSYESKFSDFVRCQTGGHEFGLNLNHDFSGFSCKLLFQKDLTPSDVSKLNRLVIPKQCAIKYFPPIANDTKEDTDGKKMDEVFLFFCDRSMKVWKFRYCYWKSSQSFVFTRGWNRFVKDKELKGTDTIAFYICEGKEGPNKRRSFWLIDVIRSEDTTGVSAIETVGQNVDVGQDDGDVDSDEDTGPVLGLRVGQPVAGEVKEESHDDQGWTEFEGTRRRKKVRVFGVDFN